MNTDRIGRITVILGNGVATVKEVDHRSVVLGVHSNPDVHLASTLGDDGHQIEERDLDDFAERPSACRHGKKLVETHGLMPTSNR